MSRLSVLLCILFFLGAIAYAVFYGNL